MTVPVVIVGAGPAGLAAAGALARCGASAIVVDERPRAGGRLRDHPHGAGDGRVGIEIVEGLLADVPADRVEIRSETVVWGLFERWRVAASAAANTQILDAPAVILAAGLVPQITPFPGWTIPGVMTAHAARELLRRHVKPGRRAAVIGKTALGVWITHELRAAGVHVTGPLEATNLRAEGSPRVRRLVIEGRDDQAGAHLDVELVVLAGGISPLIELALQAGCRATYEERLGGYVPTFTSELATSQPDILVTGGIIGAQAPEEAVALGWLAGTAAAAAIGAIDVPAVERVRRETWDALEAHTRREGAVERFEAWRAITGMGTVS